MGNFKKESSVEDVLRKQIEKQEYFDDGGSGGNPPSGGGGDSGGSEDEGLSGIMDEAVQVFLATVAFILLVIISLVFCLTIRNSKAHCFPLRVRSKGRFSCNGSIPLRVPQYYLQFIGNFIC